MLIISFAWTTPALLAYRKTCTRRNWNDSYAKRFHADDLVQAYDRSPRVGGKPVRVIRLTHNPVKGRYCDVTDQDWEDEGFAYLEAIGARVNGMRPLNLWERWRQDPSFIWVVRFTLIVKGD